MFPRGPEEEGNQGKAGGVRPQGRDTVVAGQYPVDQGTQEKTKFGYFYDVN